MHAKQKLSKVATSGARAQAREPAGMRRLSLVFLSGQAKDKCVCVSLASLVSGLALVCRPADERGGIDGASDSHRAS